MSNASMNREVEQSLVDQIYTVLGEHLEDITQSTSRIVVFRRYDEPATYRVVLTGPVPPPRTTSSTASTTCSASTAAPVSG